VEGGVCAFLSPLDLLHIGSGKERSKRGETSRKKVIRGNGKHQVRDILASAKRQLTGKNVIRERRASSFQEGKEGIARVARFPEAPHRPTISHMGLKGGFVRGTVQKKHKEGMMMKRGSWGRSLLLLDPGRAEVVGGELGERGRKSPTRGPTKKLGVGLSVSSME